MSSTRYYPDYPRGIETPHSVLFSYVCTAPVASEADVPEVIDACARQLDHLPPAQIAFELIRLYQMLSCVRLQAAAELVMKRFMPRDRVRRQLLRQLRERQYDALVDHLMAAA